MKNVTNILLRRLLAVVAMSCCISNAAYASVIDFESYSLGTIDSKYAPRQTVSAFNGSSSPDLGWPFGMNDSNQINNYDHGNSTKKRRAKGKGFKKGWGKSLKKGFSSKVKLFAKDDHDKDNYARDDHGNDDHDKDNYAKDDHDNDDHDKDNYAKDDHDKDDHELLPNIYATGGHNMWSRFLFGDHGVKHDEHKKHKKHFEHKKHKKHFEHKKHGSGESHHIDPPSTGVPQVPVPAAIWLFGSGLIGLVGFARRKQVQTLNT